MLIGRDRDRSQLAETVGRYRLVTVTGPGGIGKTALVRRALTDLARPDRSGFIDLTPFEGPGLEEAVAGSLGFSSFAAMAESVDRPDWLLVFDNCEHLVDDAADVIQRLLGNTACKVLATSRQPLDLAGELLFRLEPLETTGSPSPAAELFLARAVAGISLDLERVEELCRRLDGLPLAIELAAARTGAMTPAEILAYLEGSLEMLSRQRLRDPLRHHSLAATIEWSYRLLEEDQQRSFRLLSVLEGPFTVELAAAALDLDPAGAHHQLAALVECSLLSHEPREETSWFRMLDTIGAYARTLALDQEREETWSRVAAGVVDQLSRASGEAIMGASPPPVLEAAFPTVLRVVEEARPELALALAATFWWLEDLGHQSEGADVIETLLESSPRETTGRALGVLAGLQRIAGRTARAEQAAEEAVQAGDRVGAALGRRVLGQLARGVGEWEEALAHLEAGAASAREGGQPALAIEIEMHAGMTHVRRDDLAEAIRTLEPLAEQSRTYPLCRNWARLFLAWPLLAQDPARTIALAKESLADPEANQWTVATAHLDLAMAALLQGRNDPAVDHLVRSLEGFAAIRNTTDIKLSLFAAASYLAGEGRTEQAAEVMAALRDLPGPFQLGQWELELFGHIGGPPPEPPPGTSVPGVGRVVRLLTSSHPLTPRPEPHGPALAREGELWRVSYSGVTAHVPDAKGMGDLAVLLSRPGTQVAAVDLMGAVHTESGLGAGDAAARRAYTERIRELQADLDEAEARNDPYRAEGARRELDELRERLAADYGLGGRTRRSGETAERARSAVTWRIRSAIDKIAAAHPQLGEHLDRSIRTGRFCMYEPVEPVSWEVAGETDGGPRLGSA